MDTPNKQWYILQTRSNMEKKAMSLLQERIGRSSMEHAFGNILVPEERVIEVKDGKRKETFRKLYVSYLFVEMAFSDEAWHVIKGTTYISGFVGGDERRPTAVPAREMETILARVKASYEAPVPKLEFQVGEAVTITEGPFKDFEARVEQVNYNQQKLRVSVSIFGRSTPVDLEFADVTKGV